MQGPELQIWCMLACLLVFAFNLVLLLSLFWFLFVCFSFRLFVFVFVPRNEGTFHFNVGRVGWSYNHMLIRKLTFFILELYISLKCCREVWLCLENHLLFYISKIFYKFIVIFHIDHVCACARVCLSLYVWVSTCGYMLPCKWVQFNC